MNLVALAEALRLAADALEAPDAETGPRRYTAACRYKRMTWRAMRERAKRCGVATFLVGRELEIDADKFDAAMVSEPRRARTEEPATDAASMRRLGLKLVGGGR